MPTLRQELDSQDGPWIGVYSREKGPGREPGDPLGGTHCPSHSGLNEAVLVGKSWGEKGPYSRWLLKRSGHVGRSHTASEASQKLSVPEPGEDSDQFPDVDPENQVFQLGSTLQG